MKKLTLLMFLLVLVATGCVAPAVDGLAPKVEAQKVEINKLKAENNALTQRITDLESAPPIEPAPSALSTTLLGTALQVAQLLKDEDMINLAAFIHPTAGVRFSPYSTIDLTNDVVFTAAQVPGLLADPTVYTWGSFDGSGDPIQMTTTAYFADFVYDEDYVNPHMIGNNTIIGTGNSINNLALVYPTASFVEFHFTGFDPQYGGMDWTSLRLIFENVGGNWLLIGIEHDGWTI